MVDITTAQPDLNPHCPRRVGPRVPLMYNERMQDASIQLYTLPTPRPTAASWLPTAVAILSRFFIYVTGAPDRRAVVRAVHAARLALCAVSVSQNHVSQNSAPPHKRAVRGTFQMDAARTSADDTCEHVGVRRAGSYSDNTYLSSLTRIAQSPCSTSNLSLTFAYRAPSRHD